jgi:hypothetical protein
MYSKRRCDVLLDFGKKAEEELAAYIPPPPE